MEKPVIMKFIVTVVRISLVCAVIFTLTSQKLIARAQVALNWATPERIPGLVDSNIDPILLADSEGTLHVFHSQPVNDNLGIFYIRWSLEQGWSNLVDVINSPRGDARIYGVHLDQDGWLHLIFFGGDDLSAHLFYTKAYVTSAAKSTAWTAPVLIGQDAMVPSNAALIGDKSGYLMAAYSGDAFGNGLYVVDSEDGGQTWNPIKPLWLTYNDHLWPYSLQFQLGSEPVIYSTWSVRNEVGLSDAIYFAKYDRESRQWSRPLKIAAAIGYQADTPSLIEYQGLLILIYHNDFPTTRWMQISKDGGVSWSRPIRLFSQVGSNGAAAIIEDSNEQLYLLFGNRIDTPSIHGVWQSEWLGDQWGQPEAVVSGPQIRVGVNGEEGFDPSFVQATVIRGNILFAQWRHDPQAGPTNLWYSYRIVNAPQRPFQALPTEIPTATATSTPAPIATSTPEPTNIEISVSQSPTPTKPNIQPEDPSLSNPNLSIVLGIVPVGLLIVAAIAIQRWRIR
jgi:hypothetical protein